MVTGSPLAVGRPSSANSCSRVSASRLLSPSPDAAVPPRTGYPRLRGPARAGRRGRDASSGGIVVAFGDERGRLGPKVLAFDVQVVGGDLGRPGRAVADAGGLADLAFEVGAFLGHLDPGGDVGIERSVGHQVRTPVSTDEGGWLGQLDVGAQVRQECVLQVVGQVPLAQEPQGKSVRMPTSRFDQSAVKTSEHVGRRAHGQGDGDALGGEHGQQPSRRRHVRVGRRFLQLAQAGRRPRRLDMGVGFEPGRPHRADGVEPPVEVRR